ncbi:MAG: phage portal protein [Natronosporangium sp.]
MWNPFRRKTEQRSVDTAPWDAGGVSGDPPVSESRAMRLAPVFAANRHLADNISTLPLKAYRKLGDRREPMGSLPQLLQFLETDGTLVDWLSRAVYSLAIHGNAIGLITNRDGFAFPTGVIWRPRSEFFVDDANWARPKWYWNGREIGRDELVHIPWLTVPGKTLGMSPLEAFALTVDAGLKAQEYGKDWFAAGGVPPGTFKNTAKTIQAADSQAIKERLVAAIRTRQPIVYGSDWDYNPILIPPEQAQFVESQRLTANQVASIYGIAPEEVGGEAANSLTYANEEMRQTTRLANLRPWLVRIETGLSAILPERQYVRFTADAVIRADVKSRYQVYAIARKIGLNNLDELRAMEDQPPLPDGQGKEYLPTPEPEPKPEPGQPQLESSRVNGCQPAVPVKATRKVPT